MCSLPTDRRSRSSGTVTASVPQRRRRSSMDSTPPRDVAGSHSRTASTTASARSTAPSPARSLGRTPMIAPNPFICALARW